MKLDHLVYGRGVEQSTGYALQAAPPYVRQELLLYLSDLLELGGLYSDLEAGFDKKLDVLTTQMLSPAFLNAIRREEVLIYARQ